jgi:endonuclease/exonuclease/phosphatase family metal-dependent hydrolase
VRFVTWNISSGRSTADGRVDLERFAGAVAELDADVLALQEVDRGQRRSGGADLTEIAAAAMGAADRIFAPTLYGTPGWRWTAAGDRPRGGPAYGCALLSRTPLSRPSVLRMPAAPLALPLWAPPAGIVVAREEPRVAIVADLEVDAGRSLTVVATHLPFVPLWKRIHLRRIAAAVRSRPDPVVLMGDLNLTGDTPARLIGYRGLVRAATFPAARPRLQLDHVLLRGDLPAGATVVAAAAPSPAVSDHRPLVVDIAFR